MDATAFPDRRNRRKKACKKEESIYEHRVSMHRRPKDRRPKEGSFLNWGKTQVRVNRKI